MNQVPPLAEYPGRQCGEERPLLVIEVEVRAGHFARAFADAHLVPELANHAPVACSDFAQAEARAHHVPIKDLARTRHALRKPSKTIATLSLHHCVLQ